MKFKFVFFLVLMNFFSSCGEETGVLAYRLGDMIRGYRDSAGGEAYHKKNYPDSLAVAYMDATKKNEDYDKLFTIINEQKWKERLNSVSVTYDYSTTLLIHMRVGDILDQSPYTVADHLDRSITNHNGGVYIKPLAYYEAIQKKLPSVIKKVVLITGFHTPEKSTNKSFKYMRKIEDFFTEKGYEVLPRQVDYPADEDFLLMANAKFFVQSGGGFSQAVAEMVNRRSDTVIYSEDSVPY